MLYRPSVSRASQHVEEFLVAENIATFHHELEGTFFPCVAPGQARQRAGVESPRYFPIATTHAPRLQSFVERLGGFPRCPEGAVGWEGGGPARTPPPPDPVPGTDHFATLPPGSALPGDAACAAAVRPAPETRAVNASYNARRGTRPNDLYPRVTGDFVGTTDEILQWAACKWGIDEDIVRSQIVKESWWRMTTVGDNGESYGLGQVRVPYHGTAFVDDNARLSAAYNVDYTYAVWRDCFEGRLDWLNTVERGGTYAAGDAWGCTGVWFAGRWKTAAANTYVAEVQVILAERTWETTNFIVNG